MLLINVLIGSSDSDCLLLVEMSPIDVLIGSADLGCLLLVEMSSNNILIGSADSDSLFWLNWRQVIFRFVRQT